MTVFDRPQLRRRSQSEQVIPTKAALGMTALPHRVIDASSMQQPAPQTPQMNAALSVVPGGPLTTRGSGHEYSNPSTPPQNDRTSMHVSKKAGLPPKPDAAVLAAAAKQQKKHVFFSTPTSSMRQSPILPSERVSPTLFIHAGCFNQKHMPVNESHLPPPPYTPAGLPANLPYSGARGAVFDHAACTPACTTGRHAPLLYHQLAAPVPPAPAPAPAPPHGPNASAIFPSVIAASEALRISLGLDGSNVEALNASYTAMGAVLAMPAQRSPSLPGLPLPPKQVPLDYHGSPTNVTTLHTMQDKLVSSLEPQPGQTQPFGSTNPNLPPVVNTGHKGPMKVQPGDWGCLVCSFINWRRRKYCMRCCPFAEGNTNLPASMLAAMAAAQNPLYTSIPPMPRPVYPVYATPPRQSTRGPPVIGPLPTANAHVQSTGALPLLGPYTIMPEPASHRAPLQSPFGALLPSQDNHIYGSTNDNLPAQAQDVTKSSKTSLESSRYLYDSGYARYPAQEGPAYSPLPQQGRTTELERPLTPSPGGSHSSGCSFVFSDSPPSDSDSPTTSVNSSDGSSSNTSSPNTVSKALQTPPSSKFLQLEHSQGAKGDALPETVGRATTSLEQGLDSLRF